MTHKMRSTDPIEQLRDAFKEIDADGSGSIDRSELKEMMMSMMSNDYTEEEIDAMIDKADLDGDGEIDFEGKSEYFLWFYGSVSYTLTNFQYYR